MTKQFKGLGFAETLTKTVPVGIERKKTRYIFFAGNVMSDEQMNSAQHLYLGGEYVGTDYPSLAITNYILGCCRITPITISPRLLNNDEATANPHELEIMNNLERGAGVRKDILAVRTYPAEQVQGLIYTDSNKIGKIELTKLRGIELTNEKGEGIAENYELIQTVQTFFFPKWNDIINRRAKLPETLREKEEMIRLAQSQTTDSMLIGIGDEMLESAERFRTWGTNYLELDAVKIRQGAIDKYFHNYSSVSKVLLRQLEIERETFTGRSSQPTNNQQVNDALTQIAETNKTLAEIALQNAQNTSEQMRQKTEAIAAKVNRSPGRPPIVKSAESVAQV